MAERPVLLKFPEPEADEVAAILSVLRHLATRTSSPVVRACLEETAEDIAHLTESGHRQRDADADQKAAG